MLAVQVDRRIDKMDKWDYCNNKCASEMKFSLFDRGNDGEDSGICFCLIYNKRVIHIAILFFWNDTIRLHATYLSYHI